DAGRGGVTERAERLAGDVVADVVQQVEVVLATLAVLQPLQQLDKPVGTLAARGTFATGFVAIELGHAQRRADDAGILVKDDYPAGAKHRAGGRNGLEVERRIQLVGCEVWRGGAAGNHSLELLAAAHSAAEVLDQHA